jgi:ribosomal protein L4
VGINVYDIIKYNKLLITKEALKKLEERLAWTQVN